MLEGLGPPQWVASGAEEANGLDLLALRAPAMRIGNRLLDGITTITPSIRYLTFVSWITLKYWECGGKDSRTSYLEFARRLEAAIVLGNLAVARDTTGLVGVDTAAAALDAGGAVPLAIDVRALAANAYSGPAEQLRLLETRADATVPHLTDARGIPLARELDTAVGATTLGRRLASAVPTATTTEELCEFGDRVRLQQIPARERRQLLDALMPPVPTSPQERRRLASYAAFLQCAAAGQTRREHNRLLDESVRRELGMPPILASVLAGWARYLVRDMLAVVHEHAFRAVEDCLPREENREPAFVDPRHAIEAALREGGPSLELVLRDLRLLEPRRSWTALTFFNLDDRVNDLTAAGESVEDGLRRWSGALQESDIIRAARQTRAAAPGLLAVAWLVAERRVEPGIRAGRSEFHELSHEGDARIGLTQVISRRLQSFRRSSASFLEVAGELSALTVEQHLRTAWTRLAVEGKDVAVVLSDGNRWAYRKPLSPGRTNSRLAQVDNWFRQLGLLDDDGLTAEGRSQLDQLLQTLATGVDP